MLEDNTNNTNALARMSTDSSNDDKWVLGVILGLLGSIAINTGNNIQSLGLKAAKAQSVERKPKSTGLFRRKAKISPENEGEGVDDTHACDETTAEPNPCSSTTWIIGTVIFVSGSIINFASYAFAAQSMLASLESIQFVTNLVFGKFMLKAIVTRRMLMGTILTVIGTVIAVQFSSKKTFELNVEDLTRLYGNPAYITYLVLMVCALIVLNKVFHHYEERKQLGMKLKHTDIIMPFSYSIWSALFGTQSVVQAKVLAELLALQSSGTENVFAYTFTYITFIVWLFTAWIWLYRLNKALSTFDPLFIIPLLQCSFIFFAIVSGGIFFKEFNSFTFIQWLGFWTGVFISFNGLRLLIPVQNKVDIDDIRATRRPSILSLSNDQSKDESLENCSPKSLNVVIEHSSRTENQDMFSPIRFPRDNEGHGETECEGKQITPLSGNDLLDDHTEDRMNWMTPENPDKGRIISPLRIRAMRQSITEATVSAVIESAKGVVQGSSFFLTPPGGAAALTEHFEQESDYQDELKIVQLTTLLNESEGDPAKFITTEVFELLNDLEIETECTRDKDSWATSDIEAIRLHVSPRMFWEEISNKISGWKSPRGNDYLVPKSLVLDDEVIPEENAIV